MSYRYYIGLNNDANTSVSIAFIEVQPKNTREIEFDINKEENSFIYRKKLGSDILLIDL